MKKLRIIETLIMITSIRLTQIAISYTEEIRPYKAYGGEYLIPIIALLAVFLIETVVDINKILR